MNKKFSFKNLQSAIFLIFILSSHIVAAQNLTLTLLDNTTQSFPVSNIKSLKFVSGNMVLKQNDGTITSWTIPSISNYSFGALSTEDFIVEKNDLIVYPNPSSDIVNIKFISNIDSRIRIDIIDVNGRFIATIYQGDYKKDHTFQWMSHHKGVYFCRLITENRIISKPIIIK